MQAAQAEEPIQLLVNAGEPSDDVASSLQQDGYQCVVRQHNSLHNVIEVMKHDDNQ